MSVLVSLKPEIYRDDALNGFTATQGIHARKRASHDVVVAAGLRDRR